MSEFFTALFPILVGSCAVSAFITYGLGAYVYGRNPSSPINRLFLAVTVFATFWALGEFLIWQSSTYDGYQFWLRASSLWSFVIAFSVHLSLAFTNHPLAQEDRRWVLFILLYLPALLITLVGLSTDLIFVVAFEPGTGYFYHPAATSLAYQAARAYIVLAMVCALYNGITSWRKARPGRERRQHRLILAGILAIVGFGIISGLILPAMGVHTVNFVFIGIVIFCLFIAHAIRRYGLFTLSPETAVTEILKAMPDGLILADMDGNVITGNTATADIFGVAGTELPGRPVSALISDAAYTTIRDAVANQSGFSDIEAVPRNREDGVVSIAGTPVQSPDGEPAGFVLIIRDITGRKAAETTLRTVSQKLSLLSRVTCHDIGNDIMGLSWYLNLLSENRMHPDAGVHLSQSIDIVENIKKHLSFSREYQMIGVYQPVWQPLGTMVTGAVAGIPHQGVEVSTRVAPVEVYADPLSLKVIYNLFENALRHGGEVTRMGITTTEQADGALVVVFEDDGGGVPEDEKEKIFQYGYGKNSGFGLAFARDILSVTDIAIHETGMPGQGARFEISVPPRAWRATGGAGSGPNPPDLTPPPGG